MSIEIREDQLTPALAARFAATLDREAFDAEAPQGIHWCLTTPDTATGNLRFDGHPEKIAFLPAIAQPRRMWASSAVEFFAPITVGARVQRTSRMVDMTEKSGGSGPLLFVNIQHDIAADGVLALREKQTVVYREAVEVSQPVPEPKPFPEPAPDRGEGWGWQRAIAPSTPLLFRYSALTFNTHRIHYDAPYARNEEGYPGLVVHGPLMATLLLDLCDRELGRNRLATFAFRGKAPAFANEPLLLCGRPDGKDIALAILGADGRTVMEASATIA